MRQIQILAAACALMGATMVYSQNRLPTIAPSNYSAEQKQAATEFEAARDGRLSALQVGDRNDSE